MSVYLLESDKTHEQRLVLQLLYLEWYSGVCVIANGVTVLLVWIFLGVTAVGAGGLTGVLLIVAGMTDRRLSVKRRFYTIRNGERLLPIAIAMLCFRVCQHIVSVAATSSGNYRWVLRFPGLPVLRQR